MKTDVIEFDKVLHASVTQRFAYSIEEISEQTTLSKAFIRNEIRAGRLKANHFGRRVLILNEDLRNYLMKGSSETQTA